ncbi:hypothetical protein SAMN04488512_13514 [Sulfitobacter litoralis]|uniref:Uncharacterized protein n=1 Tax=Sulfitobacter litoralis TaxID=335975 RepID=A0ABY0T0H6_9RHOB|nr:hypothetical protein SAMN04488512_13514 [Sulfitobacter litoralis]
MFAMSAQQTPVLVAANDRHDEGFSMRATARDFDAGLTLARVDKPLKEEAVGC